MEEKLTKRLIKLAELISQVLEEAAADPRTDSKSLRELAQLPDRAVSMTATLNPNIPKGVLERILDRHVGTGGEDEQLRVHVVYNPALPLKTLKRIIETDSSGEVREAALTALAMRLSKSPSAAPEELWKAYATLFERPTVSRGKRQQAAKAALLKHPKFPKHKIKRSSPQSVRAPVGMRLLERGAERQGR